MKRAYICGKMSNVFECNKARFLAAAKLLRAQGYDVVSPFEMDVENGFDPTGLSGDPKELEALGFSRRAALKRDTAAVCECDVLAHLPEWESSSGAVAEHALACALGLRHVYLSDADLKQADGNGKVRLQPANVIRPGMFL